MNCIGSIANRRRAVVNALALITACLPRSHHGLFGLLRTSALERCACNYEMCQRARGQQQSEAQALIRGTLLLGLKFTLSFSTCAFDRSLRHSMRYILFGLQDFQDPVVP